MVMNFIDRNELRVEARIARQVLRSAASGDNEKLAAAANRVLGDRALFIGFVNKRIEKKNSKKNLTNWRDKVKVMFARFTKWIR